MLGNASWFFYAWYAEINYWEILQPLCLDITTANSPLSPNSLTHTFALATISFLAKEEIIMWHSVKSCWADFLIWNVFQMKNARKWNVSALTNIRFRIKQARYLCKQIHLNSVDLHYWLGMQMLGFLGRYRTRKKINKTSTTVSPTIFQITNYSVLQENSPLSLSI